MNHRPGRMKRLVVTLAAGAMGAALLPITPASAAVDTSEFCANVSDENPFTDVEATDVHFENILCLAALEITIGLTETTYGPGQSTGRGQMASFIARFIDKANELEITDLAELSETAPDAFPDDDGNTHEDNINRLAEAGVVEGKTDGNYDPDESVNRSQMASYITRAIGFLTGTPLAEGPDAFPDDDDSVHEANINALAAIEVVEGKTDGDYDPGEDVNRSQMASFIIRSAAYLHAEGHLNPAPAGPSDGPITLESLSIPQGGTVRGTVANPTEVASISVSGCGIATQNVSVGGDGSFSFPLPPDTGPGTCTLTFTINETDGDSVTQTFTITVTAVAQLITGAPDLIAVTPSTASNQLIYTFDEDVTSVAANFFAGFGIYAADGSSQAAIAATILPNGTDVVATFLLPPGSQLAEFVVLGSVDRDTVEDAGGRNNYDDSAPVLSTAANRTIGPDLVAVNNIGTDAEGRQLADFVFDEAVDPATFIDVTQFWLVPASTQPILAGANVAANGAIGVVQDGLFQGPETALLIDGLIDITANGTTLRMHFGDTFPSPFANINTATVRRGFVDNDGIISADLAANNALDAADVGTGISDTPDLVSVSVAGPNEVEFNFDEPVATQAGGQLDPAGFVGWSVAGPVTEAVAVSAVRSATDTKKVTANFGPNIVQGLVRVGVLDGTTTLNHALPVAACVGGVFAGPATVCGTTGPALPNIGDAMPLQATTAGKTALPDLVEITRTPFPTGDYLVTYKFDQPLAPGYPVCNPLDFTLITPAGDIITATDCVVAGSNVNISTNVTTVGPGIPQGFSIADVESAAAGAVNETAAGFGPNNNFTEGADELNALAG